VLVSKLGLVCLHDRYGVWVSIKGLGFDFELKLKVNWRLGTKPDILFLGSWFESGKSEI
jgi:hypothetical protein